MTDFTDENSAWDGAWGPKPTAEEAAPERPEASAEWSLEPFDPELPF